MLALQVVVGLAIASTGASVVRWCRGILADPGRFAAAVEHLPASAVGRRSTAWFVRRRLRGAGLGQLAPSALKVVELARSTPLFATAWATAGRVAIVVRPRLRRRRRVTAAMLGMAAAGMLAKATRPAGRARAPRT